MKKILIGLFLLPIVFANAQENKNKFVVNGNLRVSYYFDNPLQLDGFSIGYFPTDHFSIGITGRYSNTKDTYNYEDVMNYHNSNKSQQSENFAGAYARYNFASKSKFSFFLYLNNSYRWNKYKNEYTYLSNGIEIKNSSDAFSKGYNVSLAPGIIYFIHPKFSAEISLGSIFYQYNKQKDIVNPEISKNSSIGAGFLTSGLNIGLSYYFSCKNKNEEK